jgi:hypothetical protein
MMGLGKGFEDEKEAPDNAAHKEKSDIAQVGFAENQKRNSWTSRLQP